MDSTIIKGTVFHKFVEEEFLYVEYDEGYIRVDFDELEDEDIASVGDEMEVEIRGKYWVRGKITNRIMVNWRKDGF